MADLRMFIESFRVFKTSSASGDTEQKPTDKPTVTDITGGSFHIPSEKMDTFYVNYAKAISEGKKLTYLETPNRELDYGVVKVDFDFRYPGDNGLKRMYTKDTIKSIASVYQNTIKKYFNIDEYGLTCFVTERTSPYKIEKEDKIRDGFHLFFNIGLPYSFQYVLRNIVIDAITENGLIESVGTLNPVQDVVDKSVVETGNWFIYGSRKTNLEPYLLTMELDHNGEELDIRRWKLIDLIKTFGIRKEIEKATYISKELELEIKDRAPVKIKANGLAKIKKVALEKQLSLSTSLPENCEHIRALVNILSEERRDSYKPWFELGACLFNIDSRLLTVWIDFSKTSPKYEEGVCQKFWNGFKKDNLGIASLNYWAKLDNPQEFEKIRRNGVRYKLEQSIRTPSHFDIALVVHDMFKHMFVCVSPKYKTWYRFNGNHWEESELGMCVRGVLSREVATEYLRYANECNQKIMQLNASNDVDSESGNDNIVKALEEKVKSANKIASSLKTTTYKDCVVKEACELFMDSTFMEKLDNNLMLIGVKNGVIDLEKREFREGRPDDYVGKKCNINYIPCDMNDADYREKLNFVEDFFKKILPIEGVRKYLLHRFASCLEGTNDQHFPILSGTGGNGKTILLEFMQEIFGEYACSISSTVFTQKSGSASAASPEIARIRGIRLISAEETEEGSTINVAKVKEYTGGSKITPRKLFGDVEEFKPQAHWFLVCNNIPKITSDDGGTWRRILIVEFPSSFVDDPTDERFEGIPYVFKKDETVGQKLYECREVFFSYLFHHYYNEYKTQGNVEPHEVKMATNNYRQENDLFFQYIKERIIKNPLSILKISEGYGDFKYWFKEAGLDAKIPSNKEFKKYFEKKFGQYGSHASKTAGWKGIAILPREIDLETPADCDEKDL